MKEKIDYVKRFQYRLKAIKSLDSSKYASEISNKTGIIPNHISNVLRQLREHDLVECINPEVKKGRLYRLTDKGKIVIENIDILINSLQ